MTSPLILASSSEIRRQLLAGAGVDVQISPARVDEESIKASLLAENAKPHDIVDTLAEYKARRVAQKFTEGLVLGCDQILVFDGKIFSKAETEHELCDQLMELSGARHQLFSAAVIYDAGKPVWRSIGKAQMHMRKLSRPFVEAYVSRNWSYIRHCVGGYQLEAEGVRLFERVEGDYFSVLGLPLLDILNYLTLRDFLES
ncbi:MAG: Maf family nucleotide pyrophosphatase [Pseudomonadota bacterium]